MKHVAIEQVISRTEFAKLDSDFTYFFSLLLASEAIAKTIILGMVSAISDAKYRNRYRLEHPLVRSDGFGAWGRVLEYAITGPASQLLLAEPRQEPMELTQLCISRRWHYAALTSMNLDDRRTGRE